MIPSYPSSALSQVGRLSRKSTLITNPFRGALHLPRGVWARKPASSHFVCTSSGSGAAAFGFAGVHATKTGHHAKAHNTATDTSLGPLSCPFPKTPTALRNLKRARMTHTKTRVKPRLKKFCWSPICRGQLPGGKQGVQAWVKTMMH